MKEKTFNGRHIFKKKITKHFKVKVELLVKPRKVRNPKHFWIYKT